ncbi:MAG: M24 family metallopeptidase, partial [Nanoarchaeota archaeon]|nr:M24 family metallopeptidase [Nanoarchaeota archaeon]
ANEFERLAKEKGAEGLSFDTILVSGKNSALVHGKPSDKKIRQGDLVLIDFGCVYKGYRSDQTVTYGVGKLSNKAINIYETVREAQIQALNIIKPGVELIKPYKIAEEYIKSKGYEFVHGLGHGVGLQIHEQPNVSLSAKGIFQEGMVVTVEPGVYVENVGGVRIEDLIVVTKNGYKKLTSLPKGLEIL